MNYLKLNSNSNKIIKSISRQSINRLNNCNSNGRFNNDNSSFKNERNYSSFSMKDQEPERPKSNFGFKSLLALGLVVAAGSYLYYLRDNEDALFSSKLPYQKEDVEKFKLLMRDMKRKQEELHHSNNTSSKQEEKPVGAEVPVNENKEPEKIITPEDVQEFIPELPVAVVLVEKEIQEENKQHEEKEHEDVNKLVEEKSNQEKKSNDGYGFSSSDSYDEINSEEADLDNSNSNDDEDDGKSGSSGNNENENENDDSAGKEFLEIVAKEVEEHEKQHQQEIPVKEVELPKTEYITIIEEKKDNDNQIKVESTSPSNEDNSIISEIIQDVLSLIPIQLNGTEKTEDIVKILEKQYHDMAQSLINENGKLKEELEKINLNKDEYLKSFEEFIKDKYKLALDATIDLLHGDLGEKLKDMDKYIQDSVGENQKLVKETLDRQKDHLINIFNQQSEAIKKSEVEKRAVTQLTQLIVDIEKLLRDASAQGKLVERSFKNLTDLEQYDELIAQLLKSLPKDFTKDGVINFEKLQNEFKSVSKEIRKVTLISPQDDSLFGKIVSFVGSKLILPEYGLVQGDHPDAYLSRTEEYLRRGDLTKAIKEMESLTENNKDLSKYTSQWLNDAKQRDQLENISKLLQLKLELIQKQQLEQNEKNSQTTTKSD